MIFRPFSSDMDLESVRGMCRDVYGGQDWLPAALSGEDGASAPLHKRPGVAVIVGVSCGGGDEAGEMVVAVGAVELRGGGGASQHAWLSGLRVAPEARGRGLSVALLRELRETAVRAAGGASASSSLVAASSTIPANAAMLRSFARDGWVVERQVAVFPGWATTYSCDEEAGGCRRTGAATLAAPGLAGVRSRLEEASAEGGADRRWTALDPTDGAAVARAAAEVATHAGTTVPAIPLEYTIWRVGGGGARGDMAPLPALLGADVLASSSGTPAALVVWRSSEEMRGRVVAGVVAVDASAAASAMLRLDARAPHGRFVAFVDLATLDRGTDGDGDDDEGNDGDGNDGDWGNGGVPRPAASAGSWLDAATTEVDGDPLARARFVGLVRRAMDH